MFFSIPPCHGVISCDDHDKTHSPPRSPRSVDDIITSLRAEIEDDLPYESRTSEFDGTRYVEHVLNEHDSYIVAGVYRVLLKGKIAITHEPEDILNIVTRRKRYTGINNVLVADKGGVG